MKKIHLTALRATIFALITSTSLHAQTSITLDGTSGTNLFTNNYAGNIIFSLGFFADYLVVGGGGGGGGSGTDTNAWGGGGGGAGGLLQGNTQLSASNYSVTVGAGGAGGPRSGTTSAQQGTNGGNSVFGSLTAIGGGGGGAFKVQGTSGGSGGGGGGRGTGNDLRTPGGAGTTNGSIVQGFAGGASRDDDSSGRVAGGGGGGAGAVGGTGGTNASVAGNGGAGLTNAITGTATVYAGGGGGGAWDNFEGETAGTGGAGGGGSGSTSGNASNGTNGLGGGGGGVGTQGAGGSGGSGVVIVRYQGSSLGPIGGTVTSGTGSAAGSTLHTFTNTGSANFDMAGVNLTNRLGATISGNVSAARIGFDGPGTLTLAGSNNANSTGLHANSGTVRLTGQFNGGLVYIADPTNSTAAIVVDGGDFVTSRLAVGQRGNGTLTLESGTISNNTTILGYSTSYPGVTNGTGTATINGGTWSNRSDIFIGDSGAGTLNVNGGTMNVGRIMSVGRYNGGNGVVNVTGGSLSVGTLFIDTGNGQGVVNVTGGTLTATNAGISVGAGGLTNGGVLNISNAGTVVSHSGLVLSSTNSELNLGAGGTLRIGQWLSTANPAGLQVNGALEFAGDSVTFQGKLSIGSGGTNGSLSGNLYDPSGGSSVTFNRSDDLTYSGNLLGLAALIKEGAGTLTLSGSNNFRGDTLVNNGRLVLGSSSALRSGAVVKVNTNGTIEAAQRVVIGYLDVNGGTVVGSNNLVSALTLVNSGQVAGLADGVDFAAGILKRTAGTATVDGANTFTGLIRVEDGLLQLTNGGSFAAASSLVVSNAASVDLNGVSQQFSTVNGAGSVALGSGTLTVGGSEDSALSGAISGTGGLVKSGGGVMTLSGTSTYNGATTVSGGELIVDGAADSSTVTVNSGATLSGSGSIGGLIVNTGGTINPGNSPGTQTVVGNAVWNVGGNYNWQIHDVAGTAGSSTGWDLLNITGTLNLGALSVGSEFKINLWSLSQVVPDINGDAVNFDPAQNYTWTIATAAGGITNYTGANQFFVNTGATNGTGGFSNLLDNGTFSVVQSGNDLNLVFTSASAPIPEPGTWAAMAIFAGGAAYAGWRRRK